MTHCLTSESVLGEAGFTVRATSLEASDPLLSIAMNLNAYELPLLAYYGARPYPWAAPIRLAAIPIKNHPIKDQDLVAIMHSVYMETDTRGRPNSYFTHVIFVPKDDFSWRTTLKSWGAIQWKMPNVSPNPEKAFNPPRWITQWQNGAPIKLPKLETLPESGLNDKYFEAELYKYYGEKPKTLVLVWGAVLARLRKKAEPEKGTEPIRGYLIPRSKCEENQCEGYYPDPEPSEEDYPCWPKETQFGENIHETLMQLAFIAWFFPEKLLNDQGFSTYEPHKYGVSIANDKLLVGIVHAKSEKPDEMMKSQGVEYYSPEKEGSLVVDPSDKLFEWGKLQIDQIFKNEKKLITFSDDINRSFKSVENQKTGLDCYEESKNLFDSIEKYQKDQNLTAALELLSFAETYDYALEKFKDKRENALINFVDGCYSNYEAKKVKFTKKLLDKLFNKKYFDLANVLGYLSSEKFLKLKNYGNKKNDKISFIDWMIDSQAKNGFKKTLIEAIKKIFFKEENSRTWKKDPARITQLFELFFKNKELEFAKELILKTDYETVVVCFTPYFKEEPAGVYWSFILPCLMEASIDKGIVNKELAKLYKEEIFLYLLEKIIDSERVDWKSFIRLYQNKDEKRCLTLANILVNSISQASLWLLLEYLLTEPDLLTERQVQDFLFSKPAAILKIIPIKEWSDEWLLKLVNQYLFNLDISSLFPVKLTVADLNPERDSLVNVFSELSKLLANSINIEDQNLSPIKAIVEAITAINRYAVDAPELFEISEFENHVRNLSDYSKKIEKNEFKNQVIEYLASCVKKHEEKVGEYGQMDGKFILLLICLKSRNPTLFRNNLIERGFFEYGTHEHLLPECIPNNLENLVNVVFSGYKNGWIKNFKNNSSSKKFQTIQFQSIQTKVANRFRLEYMVMARCYLWVGGKIDLPLKEKGEDYKLGKIVTLAFILSLFFLTPFIDGFFLGWDSNNSFTLTGPEILNSTIFGLISLTWGLNAFHSKANNFAKSNNKNEKIINQMKFFVALWSGVGVLLSVCFCFQQWFSFPFYGVLIIEILWFVVYFIITKNDPITLVLQIDTPN